MLKQVVVTVISFDHGVLREPYIARSRSQLAPELAVVDIAVAVAQQQIRTIAEHLVLAERVRPGPYEWCRRVLPS